MSSEAVIPTVVAQANRYLAECVRPRKCLSLAKMREAKRQTPTKKIDIAKLSAEQQDSIRYIIKECTSTIRARENPTSVRQAQHKMAQIQARYTNSAITYVSPSAGSVSKPIELEDEMEVMSLGSKEDPILIE